MPTRPRRNSTIGLDYGTHSTKVVHRVRGADRGRIIRIDRPCEGYPLNATPSMIREIDGRLYFGTLATEFSCGVDYGSLKADLLQSSGDTNIDRQIDVLAASFIAWSLGEILSSDSDLAADNPIVQVSAPTSHHGDPSLNDRYLRIVHAAYTYAGKFSRVEQGVNLAFLTKEIGLVLDQPLPARGERRFFVAPETVAPIVSLQLEPITEPGIYLIADMGAATTEMSICAVNDETLGNSILAYADSTDAQGGNVLGDLEGMIVGRSQRKLDKFLKRLRSQAEQVWYRGFEKDMRCRAARERWDKLRILLTGGATHHPDIRKHFDVLVRPILNWNEKQHKQTVDRHYPTTLLCDDGFQDEDLSLFAVANGLSVQRAMWPEFYHGEEIPALEKGVRIEVEQVPSYLEIG